MHEYNHWKQMRSSVRDVAAHCVVKTNLLDWKEICLIDCALNPEEEASHPACNLHCSEQQQQADLSAH